MQDNSDSDSNNLAMAASLSFGAVLKEVQTSNLNFRIEVSPFSAVIHLKKSLIKNHLGIPINPPPPKSLVIDAVKTENRQLCQKIENLENIIESNQKQVAGTLELKESLRDITSDLADLTSKLSDKENEIESLIVELNHAKVVSENLKRESKHVQKKVLAKDNEILLLQVENKNYAKTIENQRTEISNIKVEKSFIKQHHGNKHTSSEASSPSVIATVKSTGAAVKSPPQPSSQSCLHQPQCLKRDPRLPPASFPLNWSQHHNHFDPKAPPQIRLLPMDVSSIHAFNSLHNDHLCEDCEPGAIFHNHHEIVHYPDPGPQGGTSGRQVKTCPNNVNASGIKVLTLQEEYLPQWKIQKNNQKKFKYAVCEQKFKTQNQMIFHLNRKHG